MPHVVPTDPPGNARRLRTRPWGRQLALYALTGWGPPDDERRAKEAGFDGHLVKPFDVALLEELISSKHSGAR